MKKLLTLALALILCICSLGAYASGFDGLVPNGGDKSDSATALPDPAEAMKDVYGTIINSDYEFMDGYFCSVYSYEKPLVINTFTDNYSGLCRQAGYTVTETTVDGQSGYSIQNGDGLYAMLFPDVNGQMLFMVQTGMNFTLNTRMNYATMKYNGRTYEYECNHYGSDIYAFMDIYSWDFMLHAIGNSPIGYLNFYIPVGVSEGTEYYITEDSDVHGFGLMIPTGFVLDPYDEGEYSLRSVGDYAHLVITRCEDTDRGVIMEGSFSCCLNGGDFIIEDLVFSVTLSE